MHKHFKLFITISLALSLLFLPSSGAKANDSKDGEIVISPVKDQPQGHINRSPALIPISAYYDSFSQNILISFTGNLGIIEIEIMNETNGDYWDIEVDSQNSSVIYIGDESGLYEIVFTLQSGVQYHGYFEIL